MQITNPFCDIKAAYDPDFQRNSVENVLDWNPSETFKAYLAAFRERRSQERAQAVEDALMAVIDSMNASEEDGASRDQAVSNAVFSASRSISEQTDNRADPTAFPEVQAMLACLGDRARLEMADSVQEEHERQLERLEAREARETLKGGETDECDRPVYDAADAADGGWDGEPANQR